MSILFYVKDGPRPDNTGRPHKINLTDLYKYLPIINANFLGTKPPLFNENSPSMYPEQVVVEVLQDEVDSNKFQDVGFYLLIDITPDDENLSKVPKQLEIE